MTSKDRWAEDREALERLLDIHGADRTRWPARERLKFASVISEDEAAAALLVEARALERLLDRAPQVSEASVDALKERIVAAALRSQPRRFTTVEGDGRKPVPAKGWLGQLRRPSASMSFTQLPAAAVLAASLVLGVMLGTSGTFKTTMQQVASVSGFNSSSATDSSQLALGEEVLGQSDEDLL